MRFVNIGIFFTILIAAMCFASFAMKLPMLFWFTFGILCGIILLTAIVFITVEEE